MNSLSQSTSSEDWISTFWRPRHMVNWNTVPDRLYDCARTMVRYGLHVQPRYGLMHESRVIQGPELSRINDWTWNYYHWVTCIIRHGRPVTGLEVCDRFQSTRRVATIMEDRGRNRVELKIFPRRIFPNYGRDVSRYLQDCLDSCLGPEWHRVKQ